MSIKYELAASVSKTLGKVCRIAKTGGTTLPGKIACRIYPDVLKEAAKNYKIIMVTGTNGKTTTTLMILHILEENGIRCITNKTGANLMGGITTAFLNSTGFFEKPHVQTALVEVDEAAFNTICNFMEPDILVVTNFFRDQLDRYGELYTTLSNVRNGIKKLHNTKLVLNADDSMCTSLGRDTDKRVLYYGIEPGAYNSEERLVNTDVTYCIYCKNKYVYSNHIYGHLGGYKCPGCGYMRPLSKVTCTKIGKLSSSDSQIQISIDNLKGNNLREKYIYNAKINLPGLHNIYNSLAAVSCGALLGLPVRKSLKSLESLECGFGRMETINVEDKKIKVILVKNPSSFNQALDFLNMEERRVQAAFIINDRLADGTDISWLWDVNFEKLQKISDKICCIYVSGLRAEDMALRLKYAGMDMSKISIIKDYRELIYEGLAKSSEGCCLYVFPTYTAMLDIRKQLKEMFGLKEFWK